jgi:hypothetical protein
MKPAQILLLGAFVHVSAFSEEFTAPDLTDDQQVAIDGISDGSVLGPISFLASDEMAGRDTPSRELTIASSYVASRFRGAGLEGPGPNGSYYQVHEFVTTRPPSTGAELIEDGGKLLPHLGVISGGMDFVEFTATVVDESTALAAESAEIVCLDSLNIRPQAAERPQLALAVAARRLRALQEKTTKLALILCDSDSILPLAAERLLEKPSPLKVGLTPECAVVLVSSDTNPVGKQLTIRIGAQQVQRNPVRNVIGILRGSDPELAKEAVLISAHLDHIGGQFHGVDRINNGADDNATGVTSVLSLADAFCRLKPGPKRSIVFATFWGEEKGLLGSRQFVENPLWPLSQIVANINIEMVGRPATDAREKAWMTGWKHSNLGSIMNVGSQRVGVEIFNRTDVGEMLYSRSDNYSFVRKGVIAHSFSAGSLHADYHQPTDEWEKLDIPHMTKVIQGLFAGALFIADSPVVPAVSQE